MEFSADVLIVAREDDSVAMRLRRALEKKRLCVSQVDGPAAARIFTIRAQSDSTSVVPSLPMFVRASAWWQDETSHDPDERFLRLEEYATFWAAASIVRAPVINRPGRNGPIMRMTWGEIAGMRSPHPWAAESEIYASGPELISSADGDMWGEDTNFVSAPINYLQPSVPLRARKLNPHALYEIITVVGTRAFSATEDPRSVELDLAGQSLALAQKVEAHFASITWAIDDAKATPIRLNAAPEEAELRYSWNEVADALCQDLMR
jgi:hypothetical protein